MLENTKGKSPFYPGQPVPIELFAGRKEEIERIMTRGAAQVVQGKPISIFVQGEYGIGKSSIAGFTQFRAEKEYGLYGIYASLGGAKTLQDAAVIVLQAVMQTGGFHSTRWETIKNWMAKYIKEQQLFGIKINYEALKADAPTFSTPFGMLGFLGEIQKRLGDTGIKGVFLVLDEINGIAGTENFPHFLKGLVDTNAMPGNSVPLLLMLCGVEERRREMIQRHQPIDRIFDVIDIKTMDNQEMTDFFQRAFDSARMKINADALQILRYYSAGFPKIMHIIGDAAYWLDQDGVIDKEDASKAVIIAADEVGKKYVEQQIYKALRSERYHSILEKIAKIPDRMSFTKSEVSDDLNESEKKIFHNFLQRMKGLHVIRAGEERGEYIFNMRMVQLYIWLSFVRKS